MSDERADIEIDRSLAAARGAVTPERRPGQQPAPGTKPMPVSHDLFLDHYLKRIDPQVAASFSEAQIAALKDMLGYRVAEHHAVDFRPTLTLGRRRYYMVLLMGRDRRVLTRADGGWGARLRSFFG
ncbi:MAG: hypothetical protein AAF495_27555 [Pseudomonadota bacterium]